MPLRGGNLVCQSLEAASSLSSAGRGTMKKASKAKSRKGDNDTELARLLPKSPAPVTAEVGRLFGANNVRHKVL